MDIRFHKSDLPTDYRAGSAIAIDTETMGLDVQRDRLCLVQISTGDGQADIVQIMKDQEDAPNLKTVLEDRDILKIFHFGRFDIAILKKTFGADIGPVYCTKIASRFARTFTQQHGLKDLCHDLLNLEITKEQQTSDWGSSELSEEQLRYAATDVIHLHAIKAALDEMLAREGRASLANECFRFLPIRAEIDLRGWTGKDIFAH